MKFPHVIKKQNAPPKLVVSVMGVPIILPICSRLTHHSATNGNNNAYGAKKVLMSGSVARRSFVLRSQCGKQLIKHLIILLGEL